MKDQLVKLGVPTKQVQVIYNAVDVSQFTPSPSPLADLATVFRVLFIGLASEKGLMIYCKQYRRSTAGATHS